jgi:hypothetical protein
MTGTVTASEHRMGRAQPLSVDEDAAEREESPHDETEDCPPTPRRSGFAPCVPDDVVATFLTPADYVLRSLRLHEVLADMVADHTVLPEEARALRAIADTCLALDDVADAAPYTRILLAFGARLTDLGLSEQAAPPLCESLALADALPDLRLRAAVRRTLGRALFMLGEPSCRTILEEALAMFEELGDREAALDVAALLGARAAQGRHLLSCRSRAS